MRDFLGPSPPGGPSNPHTKRVAGVRQALLEAVSEDDLRVIANPYPRTSRSFGGTDQPFYMGHLLCGNAHVGWTNESDPYQRFSRCIVRCIVCQQSQPDVPCSLHPGNRVFTHALSAFEDYLSVHEWTCCAMRARATEEGAREVLPPFSPGCTTALEHLYRAKVLFVASEANRELASDCASRLREQGFDVEQRSFMDFTSGDMKGSACVVLLPSAEESVATFQLADTSHTPGESPWIMVCNFDTTLANTRLQIASAKYYEALLDAVLAGVRAWHGRLARSHYKIFLSYRRSELAVAKAIHRFMPCWWDQAVLQPGVDWAAEIEVGIRNCSLFTLLLRGDIPNDSYVWRELDHAIRHERPVAIFAFGEEGELAVARCGLRIADFEPCTVAHRHYPDLFYRVLRGGSPSRPVLCFPNLREQLQWPAASQSHLDYDRPAAVSLLAMLRDFPVYRPYTTDAPIQIWDLLIPTSRG